MKIYEILRLKLACAKPLSFILLLLLFAVLPSMNGSSYGLDPNFILRTGIEGGSPNQSNLTVQCANNPLSPQAEQKVNIVANALSGTTPRTELSVDSIEIFLDDNITVPVAAIENNNTLDYTFRASTHSPIIKYSCRVVDNGISVFSGWKTMRVETRAIPYTSNNNSNISLDIVYIADKDSYSGITDPIFLADVEKANQLLNNETIFSKNKDKINFWIAQDLGDAKGECIVESPANWDSAYSFSEVGVVLHRDNSIRDCALLGAEELFTTNMAVSARANITLLHELGHRPFGLADEYDGDGGYFIARPFPNIFALDQLCREDELGKQRECRTIASHEREYFTSDKVPEDVMSDYLKIQMLDERRIQWWFDCQLNDDSSANATNCSGNDISDTTENKIAQTAQELATNTGSSNSEAIGQLLELMALEIDSKGGNADQAITQIGQEVAAEGEEDVAANGEEEEELQALSLSQSIALMAEKSVPEKLAIEQIAENVTQGADVSQTLVQVAERIRTPSPDNNMNQEQALGLNFTDLTEAEFLSADDDISTSDKSLVVRLNFTDLTEAEFLSADVSFGEAHSNIGNPPLLEVELFDNSGKEIQHFNYWHPQWAFELKEDGHEALTILPNSEGRIVTEFDRRIAEMRVAYIYSEDGQAVEGDQVISIDLGPTIRAFCEEFPDDPDCSLNPLVEPPSLPPPPPPSPITCLAGQQARDIDGDGIAEACVPIQSPPSITPNPCPENQRYDTIELVCVPQPTYCSDGIDNDGDGLVDKDDPDCPPPPKKEVCNDGIDNDGDGLTDLNDDEDCPPPAGAAAVAVETEGEEEEEVAVETEGGEASN